MRSIYEIVVNLSPIFGLSYYLHLSLHMTLSFKGHTVVVTGAGGGLGRASVLPLFTMMIPLVE